jgi:hypothetical protein
MAEMNFTEQAQPCAKLTQHEIALLAELIERCGLRQAAVIVGEIEKQLRD